MLESCIVYELCLSTIEISECVFGVVARGFLLSHLTITSVAAALK
jgi:hypothetical protein